MRRVALTTIPWLAAPAMAQDLPNVIVIYADDLGHGDLSCYNPKAAYQTPRLDRMAAEGIRFTDAHSPSTICSPSRYGLFSGQQIYRSTGGGGGAFEGPGGPSYLKPGTLTLGACSRRAAAAPRRAGCRSALQTFRG
jgi:arylsulfatase A-like enzyme